MYTRFDGEKVSVYPMEIVVSSIFVDPDESIIINADEEGEVSIPETILVLLKDESANLLTFSIYQFQIEMHLMTYPFTIYYPDSVVEFETA